MFSGERDRRENIIAMGVVCAEGQVISSSMNLRKVDLGLAASSTNTRQRGDNYINPGISWATILYSTASKYNSDRFGQIVSTISTIF